MLVAVKVLHTSVGEAMADFQRECATLERLRHSHVIMYLGMASNAEGQARPASLQMQVSFALLSSCSVEGSLRDRPSCTWAWRPMPRARRAPPALGAQGRHARLLLTVSSASGDTAVETRSAPQRFTGGKRVYYILSLTHMVLNSHDVPAQVLHCDTAHVQVMMVMEYMQGGDLGTALARDTSSPRRLSWYNKGRHIALGIARGLLYLHAQKVTSLCLALHFRCTICNNF